MINMNKIFLVFLILSSTVYADDGQEYVHESADLKQSQITYNDELRKTSRRLRELEGGIPLSTGTTGILTTSRGGTGQDFSAVAANSIPYFSATGTIGSIGIGTTGYVLTAGSPPNWAKASAFTLVSTTTVTSANNTGDISINNTKNYQVIVDMNTLEGTPNLITIRINNDTAASYSYVYRGFDGAATAVNGNASSGAAYITAADGLNDINGGTYVDNFMDFKIFRQGTAGKKIVVISGSMTGELAASGFHLKSDFSGRWYKASPESATSFRITATNDWTGKVYLYEIGQN